MTDVATGSETIFPRRFFFFCLIGIIFIRHKATNHLVTYQIPLSIPKWIIKTRHDPPRCHAVVKVASLDTDFLVLLFRPNNLQNNITVL